MKSFFQSEYRSARNAIIIYSFIFSSCSLIMIGCSPAPIFIKSDYEQKQIRTIAIMPVIDKRNASEDKVKSHESISNIEELLSKKIMDKNYDVLSPGSVKNTIKEKVIENTSSANLCSLLNVDVILFSELYDYSDIFFIKHSIKMGFKIFDAKGDSLWINDLDDSNRPYLSAIGASLGWAIGLSIDNKISSKNKLPTILAGVAAAELVYLIVDGLSNETSQSIDGVLKSLPDGKRSGKEIIK